MTRMLARWGRETADGPRIARIFTNGRDRGLRGWHGSDGLCWGETADYADLMGSAGVFMGSGRMQDGVACIGASAARPDTSNDAQIRHHPRRSAPSASSAVSPPFGSIFRYDIIPEDPRPSAKSAVPSPLIGHDTVSTNPRPSALSAVPLPVVHTSRSDTTLSARIRGLSDRVSRL